MTDYTRPIDRLTLTAEDLITSHPPQWANANKRVVYEISTPGDAVHRGAVQYSRWAAMPLPSTVAGPVRPHSRLRARDGFYHYGGPSEPPANAAMEWHVNFGDPSLFGSYSGSLFAQDEMQVVEHPALGSLREALIHRGFKPLTVEDGGPTPVLVVGVERRCRVAVERNAAQGRPYGLYGNDFSRAKSGIIQKATTRLDPPTLSNIVSMAAPRGEGLYGRQEIALILGTAYTAFRAATVESARVTGVSSTDTVINTGWWGCGAFGGNRVLMATLQLLAAEMAGVTALVFHTGWPADPQRLQEAARILETETAGSSPIATSEIIERLLALRFRWGVGDGT